MLVLMPYVTEKKNRANSLSDAQRIPTKEQNSVNATTLKPVTTPTSTTTTPAAPALPPRQITEQNSDDNTPSWRRPGSFRSTRTNSDNKNLNLRKSSCVNIYSQIKAKVLSVCVSINAIRTGFAMILFVIVLGFKLDFVLETRYYRYKMIMFNCIGIVDNKDKSPTSGNAPDTEVTLRRTQSFQSDPKYVPYPSLCNTLLLLLISY